MKRRVLFRVDGDKAIGLGHLYRCMALAQMLDEVFDIAFYYQSAPEFFLKELSHNNIPAHPISGEDEFIQQLDKDDLVVLDGYEFDIAFQKKIKEQQAILICIDDIHNRPLAADLVINHAPGISPSSYRVPPHSYFALGTDFSLLRPAFLKAAIQSSKRTEYRTLFICFGGSDFKGLTRTTLEVALQKDCFSTIHIVTGAAFGTDDALNTIIQAHAQVHLYHAIGEQAMIQLMLASDVAVVPSSGVLHEALACKCKVISGMYVDNQQFVYEHYKHGGYFIDAGDFSPERLSVAFDNLHQVTADSPIDGKSGHRLLKIFKKLVSGQRMLLRRASKDDFELTFKWASDPRIRAFSFQSKPIHREEHFNWYNRKITDPAVYYFLAYFEEKALGSIRFDIQNGEAIISYQIDPSFHGQGLGTILLSKGIEQLMKENADKKIFLISGVVMKSNIASVKAFEALGFEVEDHHESFKFKKQTI
jgi:UDP-2,4-diacetamido-2,4,6-trideoxy-beta-L-altropyranose hydrolase